MKKSFSYNALFAFVAMFLGIKVSACDICGCGIGGGFLGVIPQFHKNLSGYRFSQSIFTHPFSPYQSTNGDQLLRDVYYRHDFWMRYYLGDKNQVFAFIPYRMNVRQYESGRRDWISGIGDIQLNFLRQIVNQSANPERLWRHIWFLGAGIQMPTGKFMQRDPQGRMHPLPIQTGTGAWGYQFQNLYILRWKNFGFQSDVQYRFFQPNELEYQLGNALVTSANGFYWWQINPHTALLPTFGLQYESYGYDSEYKIRKPNTGGQYGLLVFGLDVYYKNLIIQWFGQIPVYENTTNVQPGVGTRTGLGVALFW